MAGLRNISELLARYLAVLGVVGYCAAAIATLLDVVARQFGLSVPGVVDIVQLCVLGGTYLVLPYTFLAERQVSVDLFIGGASFRVRQLARLGSALLGAALLGAMLVNVWGAMQLQMMFGDRSQNIGIPIVWYWIPLVGGVALSMLATLLLAGFVVSDAMRGERD